MLPGTDIAGATLTSYTGTASLANAGTYSCVVSNEAGMITNSTTLTVLPAASAFSAAAIAASPIAWYRLGEPSGAISYDGPNHQRMTELRAAKVAGVEVPEIEVTDNVDAELLVLGWGSSYGTIRAGARRVQERGGQVATTHLRYLNPMPANLGEVLREYERVLVPEMNSGQLAHELRARFLLDVESYTKVQGQPLLPSEMEQAMLERL